MLLGTENKPNKYRFLSILSEWSSSFVDISFSQLAASDFSSLCLAMMSEEVSASLCSRSRTGFWNSCASCRDSISVSNASTAAHSATSRQRSSDNTTFKPGFHYPSWRPDPANSGSGNWALLVYEKYRLTIVNFSHSMLWFCCLALDDYRPIFLLLLLLLCSCLSFVHCEITFAAVQWLNCSATGGDPYFCTGLYGPMF